MKNKLEDLNNHLFEQLERLNDEDLQGDKLETEIERSKAVSGIAKDIISNAELNLNALKLKAEYMGLQQGDMPAMLGNGSK